MELGQVWTSEVVAKLMVNEIMPLIKKDSKILDPCIGKNIFPYCLNQMDGSLDITGIEVDKSLIDEPIKNFYKGTGKNLILDNFFNLDLNDKFDFIIMNPPYVRHEKIQYSKNSKKELNSCLNEYFPDIPQKSNLYIYFILKTLLHLKENGYLVAITYDSWLFADFGEYIKKILINDYTIESIVHFKKDAFFGADVGSTILLISNSTSNDSKIKYYEFNSQNEINVPDIDEYDFIWLTNEDLLDFNNRNTFLEFSNDFFWPISDISEKTMNRGMSALVNKFFIFKDKEFGSYTKPFIKQVSKIDSFAAYPTDFLLCLEKEEIQDENLMNYINCVKNEVINNQNNYKSLYNKISKNEFWFSINQKSSGNIIFNYYMRDKIDFLYNENLDLVSDNFYNLYVEDNVFENFAILNSNFTKYAILKNSRSQGIGLFKIQLKQFKDVPIINVNKLSEDARLKLNNLGKKFLNQNRDNCDSIISQIDEILIKEYNSYFDADINRNILINKINEIKHGE